MLFPFVAMVLNPTDRGEVRVKESREDAATGAETRVKNANGEYMRTEGHNSPAKLLFRGPSGNSDPRDLT